jgi:hypothetical protein
MDTLTILGIIGMGLPVIAIVVTVLVRGRKIYE